MSWSGSNMICGFYWTYSAEAERKLRSEGERRGKEDNREGEKADKVGRERERKGRGEEERRN